MKSPWPLGLILGLWIGTIGFNGFVLWIVLADGPPAATGKPASAGPQCSDLPERFVMPRAPRPLDWSIHSGEWVSLSGAELVVLSCSREVLVRVEATWEANPSPNKSAFVGDEFWLLLKTALYESGKAATEAEFGTGLRKSGE